MKKAGLILIALFSAGFIMAQNTATVTETGDANTAYINQHGTNNLATMTQIGDKNGAAVADHYASSLYSVLTGTKGITQEGEDNKGKITQTNSSTGTVLAGPEAGMGQYGKNNNATITQSHNAVYMQEYAWVKQVGDGNTSLQNQASLYGFSHVLQDGNANQAETQQKGGYGHKANIWQDGNSNKANQFQGSVSLGYTSNNLAEATQKGDENISNQGQYGSANTAKTIQETSWNTANLTQNGNSNGAKVLQKNGDFNVVNLAQNGGAQADIIQDGNHNTLMGIGTDPITTSFGGSILDLDQIGSLNTLHLQQTNGASATVMQNGASNVTTVIQN